jgi:hypothetical protein
VTAPADSSHLVTVYLTPTGTVHGHLRCTGAGRHAGRLAVQTMTIPDFTAVPVEKICACLRRRWGTYRQNLGLAPKFRRT